MGVSWKKPGLGYCKMAGKGGGFVVVVVVGGWVVGGGGGEDSQSNGTAGRLACSSHDAPAFPVTLIHESLHCCTSVRPFKAAK